MFNKTGFNGTFYNRLRPTNVYLETLMISAGVMGLNLTIFNHMSGALSGNGTISNGELNAITEIRTNTMVGGGDLALTHLVYFFLPMDIAMSGQSGFSQTISIGTVIDGADFNGAGDLSFTNVNAILQNMVADIRGTGDLATDIDLLTFMQPFNLGGDGQVMDSGLTLSLPLNNTLISGEGNLRIRRFGLLENDIFELDGINLLPGQTVTIDTDLLNVLFNGIPDVSSVTSDSIFFEVLPGDTNFTIDVSPNEPIQVNIIWQNRWL